MRLLVDVEGKGVRGGKWQYTGQELGGAPGAAGIHQTILSF